MIRGLPHKMSHLFGQGLVAQWAKDLEAVERLASPATCQSSADIHPLWRGLVDDKPKGLRRIGYAGEYELRDAGGKPVVQWSKIRTHVRDEDMWLEDGTAPHKEGSTGRVYTSAGAYFPNVFDLRWVKL